MVEAVRGDFRAAFRLGEDKGALKHALREKRRALWRPVGVRRVERLGLGDIGLDPGRMFADVAVAGRADRGMGLIGFLSHRSEQAGELRQFALKDRLAEIDIGEYPVAR